MYTMREVNEMLRDLILNGRLDWLPFIRSLTMEKWVNRLLYSIYAVCFWTFCVVSYIPMTLYYKRQARAEDIVEDLEIFNFDPSNKKHQKLLRKYFNKSYQRVAKRERSYRPRNRDPYTLCLIDNYVEVKGDLDRFSGCLSMYVLNKAKGFYNYLREQETYNGLDVTVFKLRQEDYKAYHSIYKNTKEFLFFTEPEETSALREKIASW